MKNNTKLGFTLVELLVVIAIMGVLASISFVALNTVRDKANDAHRISELTQMRKALEIYYQAHGYYPQFSTPSWGTSKPFDDWEIARNWGDIIDTLHGEGIFLETAELDNSGYNMAVQDPLYDPTSHANSYQYMPSGDRADPTPDSKPQNFRIRVKLENLNNPILDNSYDGPFFYYDEDHEGSYNNQLNSCTSDLGYWCIGPPENFETFVSGKPVIYLYPTEKTAVSVEVNTKKITESIPDYNGGWNVTAYPDGTIENSVDGQTYPYLFWEGPSYKPRVDRTKGFVIATNQVESFLAEKLGAQGLKAKEYDEFIEFWAPRMKNKDYVYVYFMPQVDYDKLIPMDISPQPDTVIRTYMLFKSLDEPIDVAPQKLSAPERIGFTVVEWGGDLKELK